MISLCLIPSPKPLSSVNEWMYDLRQVLEHIMHTSTPGSLHLLVLWPGTLSSQILLWLVLLCL